MIVTLEEVKIYLRVDSDDDDANLEDMISMAESLCMDILRTDDIETLAECDKAKVAIMYTVAYAYEHRDEADHHALTNTLRHWLEGDRKAAF